MFLHPSLLCLDKPTNLHVVLTIANAFHKLQIMEDPQHRSTSGLELLNQIADSDLARVIEAGQSARPTVIDVDDAP